MTPIERAAAVFVDGLREQRERSAREAAELARHAGGPSVDELERRITEHRAAESEAER